MDVATIALRLAEGIRVKKVLPDLVRELQGLLPDACYCSVILPAPCTCAALTGYANFLLPGEVWEAQYNPYASLAGATLRTAVHDMGCSADYSPRSLCVAQAHHSLLPQQNDWLRTTVRTHKQPDKGMDGTNDPARLRCGDAVSDQQGLPMVTTPPSADLGCRAVSGELSCCSSMSCSGANCSSCVALPSATQTSSLRSSFDCTYSDSCRMSELNVAAKERVGGTSGDAVLFNCVDEGIGDDGSRNGDSHQSICSSVLGRQGSLLDHLGRQGSLLEPLEIGALDYTDLCGSTLAANPWRVPPTLTDIDCGAVRFGCNAILSIPISQLSSIESSIAEGFCGWQPSSSSDDEHEPAAGVLQIGFASNIPHISWYAAIGRALAAALSKVLPHMPSSATISTTATSRDAASLAPASMGSKLWTGALDPCWEGALDPRCEGALDPCWDPEVVHKPPGQHPSPVNSAAYMSASDALAAKDMDMSASPADSQVDAVGYSKAEGVLEALVDDFDGYFDAAFEVAYLQEMHQLEKVSRSGLGQRSPGEHTPDGGVTQAMAQITAYMAEGVGDSICDGKHYAFEHDVGLAHSSTGSPFTLDDHHAGASLAPLCHYQTYQMELSEPPRRPMCLLQLHAELTQGQAAVLSPCASRRATTAVEEQTVDSDDCVAGGAHDRALNAKEPATHAADGSRVKGESICSMFGPNQANGDPVDCIVACKVTPAAGKATKVETDRTLLRSGSSIRRVLLTRLAKGMRVITSDKGASASAAVQSPITKGSAVVNEGCTITAAAHSHQPAQAAFYSAPLNNDWRTEQAFVRWKWQRCARLTSWALQLLMLLLLHWITAVVAQSRCFLVISSDTAVILMVFASAALLAWMAAPSPASNKSRCSCVNAGMVSTASALSNVVNGVCTLMVVVPAPWTAWSSGVGRAMLVTTALALLLAAQVVQTAWVTYAWPACCLRILLLLGLLGGDPLAAPLDPPLGLGDNRGLWGGSNRWWGFVVLEQVMFSAVQAGVAWLIDQRQRTLFAQDADHLY